MTIIPKVIALDFDGTCVGHRFPSIGPDVGAVPVLLELVEFGHKLILSSIRSHDLSPKTRFKHGSALQDAVHWFSSKGISLYGVYLDPYQHTWTSSPKVHADLIIDDRALGCPTIFDPNISHRRYVNWIEVRKLLVKNEFLPAENEDVTSLTHHSNSSYLNELNIV